jgi:hypothetical protein
LFTRSDVSTLISNAPPVGASIFLPTHIRGAEVRQDPIRLKNLIGRAEDELLSVGMTQAQADAFVAPATALLDDYAFWQHQSQGLAVFLDGSSMRYYRVPIALEERIMVGRGFHVKPLLPLLEANGTFQVLTITQERVRLLDASRFAMVDAEDADLPSDLHEFSRTSDYENPVQASPAARPHTGSANISHAQVYGDSPPEWKKTRLVESLRRLGSAVERELAARQAPLVLIANAEISGHFQKHASLDPLLLGVIEADPEAMDDEQLHAAAYAAVRPHFDADRRDALERFKILHGNGDDRAITSLDEIVRAAHQGRLDTLLMVRDSAAWGIYDASTNEVSTGDNLATAGEDLLDAAAAQTIEHGGGVHLLDREDLPDRGNAAAILRYSSPNTQ